MDHNEELNEISETLTAVTDIIMAMEAYVEHGGIVTRESLAHISNVTFDCKKRINEIMTENPPDAVMC